MNEDRWRPFLQHGTRTGKVATVRRDGRAHIAPVWFVLDADDIVFTTGSNTVKPITWPASPGWSCASMTRTRLMPRHR